MTGRKPEKYTDVFRLYHHAIYPHYLTGVPAIFAVPNFRQLEKRLASISDPLPWAAHSREKKRCATYHNQNRILSRFVMEAGPASEEAGAGGIRL